MRLRAFCPILRRNSPTGAARRFNHIGNSGVEIAAPGAKLVRVMHLKTRMAVLCLSSLVAAASAAPAPKDVLGVMERVADWQLANPSKHKPTDWTCAAGYAGFMALSEISASPRFHEAMLAMGAANEWKPGPRPYHADDHAVGQTYVALYQRHKDPKMIAPLKERFDFILANPMDDDLRFVGPKKNDRWAWCDALFMGPPAWLRLSLATGNPAYLDFMVTHWWKTSAYLYDKDEHLYYRDSTYFEKREANGKKIFWSRGNGWVMGGLARVLQDLPANHPARGKFVQQFKEMAASVAAVQQADGLWRASLLDPASFPLKETSGSGFYCYAFAWGVNHGLLDRATYGAAAEKAWTALTACVTPEGKLTHVQPIGADPKKFDEGATEIYGVGAFLLAGSEIYRMAGGK
jgi:unsaturated rhamnogalacturonyl hydrolase